MQLKEFIIKIAKEKGHSLESLSIELGRSQSSLRRTVTNGSLKVSDLEEILKLLGSELVVEYNKEKNIIKVLQ